MRDTEKKLLRTRSVILTILDPLWGWEVVTGIVVVIPTGPDGSVLLGRKARGFGAGKFCGFGGKVEPTDNSIEEAASRELFEETGLSRSSTLKKLGLLLYTFDSEPELALQIHAFSCQLDGSEHLVPSDEFEYPLRWFGSDGPPLPLEQMVGGPESSESFTQTEHLSDLHDCRLKCQKHDTVI
jgi:8-oxo-dGTP pyrophosphatase MutT (NUDIX family)